jgi:F-type H+-transporting ATPase subunit epsilon
MSFLLKIIVPERVVLEVNATSVILPSALGEIEILEGHLPIIGILEAGTVFYTVDNQRIPIAVDCGFFKFSNATLVVLTEAAIDVKSLDESAIDMAVQRAQEALEKARTEKQMDSEELDRLDKILRFNVAQKLTKHAQR